MQQKSSDLMNLLLPGQRSRSQSFTKLWRKMSHCEQMVTRPSNLHEDVKLPRNLCCIGEGNGNFCRGMLCLTLLSCVYSEHRPMCQGICMVLFGSFLAVSTVRMIVRFVYFVRSFVRSFICSITKRIETFTAVSTHRARLPGS